MDKFVRLERLECVENSREELSCSLILVVEDLSTECIGWVGGAVCRLTSPGGCGWRIDRV